MTALWDGTPAGNALSPPWSGVQCKPGRITVVPPPPGAPAGDTRKWMRFEVRHGDLIGSDTICERAQLIANTAAAAFGKEGQAMYVAQSAIFDPAYTPPATDPMPRWNIWKQYDSEPGQAPFNFQIDARTMHVIVTQNSGTDPKSPEQWVYDGGPIQRGVNIDVLEFYLWSDDPAKGRFACWFKIGAAAPFKLPLLESYKPLQQDQNGHFICQTLYAPKDIGVFPMQGWYRHTHPETDVMWQTGQKHFSTYAEAITALSPGWPAAEPGTSSPPVPPPVPLPPTSPEPTPSGIDVRVTGETATTVSLAWNQTAELGYLYEIDGSPYLVDGKRHFTFDPTLDHTTLRKPADGKQHTYTVVAIDSGESGTVTA